MEQHAFAERTQSSRQISPLRWRGDGIAAPRSALLRSERQKSRQLPSRCRKKRKNGKNELHSRFGKIHLNSCKCCSSTLSTSGKI